MGPSLRAEFEAVSLGDHRLNMRFLQMLTKMEAHRDMPYPQLFTAAELQAAYRLWSHKKLTLEEVLAPHYNATAQRAAARGTILALHDSSNITHGRAGPGRDFYALGTGIHGYVSHVSLLSTREGLPLGLGNLLCVQRGEHTCATTTAFEIESDRWIAAVRTVAQRFEALSLLHVMDSEADSYELIAALCAEGHRFVIRAEPRLVDVHSGRRWERKAMLDVLRAQPILWRRTVELSQRTASDKRSKRNASRTARTATLTARSATVQLPRPDSLRGTGPRGTPVRLSLNVVLVEEEGAPKGEPAVQWLLLTREDISTPEAVERVVDAYRGRWLIEELFKATKTGCAFERRQFETQHASQVALAMTLPLAWQLLYARAVQRQRPTAPASELLGEALPVLRRLAKRKLPPRPTVAEAMDAIAELGGHKKSNGPVGWLVLERGMKTLREALALLDLFQRSPTLPEELEM